MNRILILSGSHLQTKKRSGVPAIERYFGAHFEIIRDLRKFAPALWPSVYIISMEHGLISGDEPIKPYTQPPSIARALSINKMVLQELRKLENCADIHLSANLIYHAALHEADLIVPQMTFEDRGVGWRLAALRYWYLGQYEKMKVIPFKGPPKSFLPATISDEVRFDGKKSLSKIPTLDEGLRNLRRYFTVHGVPQPASNTRWFARIDGYELAASRAWKIATNKPKSARPIAKIREELHRMGIETYERKKS